MLVRAVGIVATAVAAFVPSCQPSCEPPAPGPAPTTTLPATTLPATTTSAPPNGIVSITVDGQGSGHGRGMSAWGNYGSAVNLRWSWQDILAYYYGGTQEGTGANSPIKVRLFGLDNAPSTGVVSTIGQAIWNGLPYTSLQAREASPNVYDIYAAADLRCPNAADGQVGSGWTLVAQGVTGPVVFTTTVDEATGPAGDVLGLCQPNGSVVHYRGSITALNDSAGANRTVNTALLELYLRGVLSREVPTSWGNAGGGAGMNALRAQAVAARSFGVSQGRYSYAQTCDTTSCQVYGGSAYRATPTSPTSFRASAVCESGNLTSECANTNRAIADTAGVVRRWPNGAIVSTEYSSSHGPRSAGGPFPAVDDSASNVPGNSSYLWTRSISAADLASRYGLGTLMAASSEADPNVAHEGVWDNRVRLVGTNATVVVSNWDFRGAYGLNSSGFAITGVVPG